jgi:nucleoid-associated protein YgaU
VDAPTIPTSGNELGAAARRIPPAGWAGIIGAGVVLGLYLRHRNAQAATPAAPVTDPVPAVGSTALTPINQSAPQTGAAVQGPPKATNNLDWLNQSLTFLIAKGVDAGVASTALHAFLNGDQLDVAGSAALKLAITEFGEPPEGIPPPHFTPPPTNPVPPAPPPVRPPVPIPLPVLQTSPPPPAPSRWPESYTVQRGDNLTVIARKFYGNDNWRPIYDANHVSLGGPISNPNLIQPGWELVIPAP